MSIVSIMYLSFKNIKLHLIKICVKTTLKYVRAWRGGAKSRFKIYKGGV